MSEEKCSVCKNEIASGICPKCNKHFCFSCTKGISKKDRDKTIHIPLCPYCKTPLNNI